MRSLPLFHRVTGQPVIVLGEGPAAEAKRRLVERAGGLVERDERKPRMMRLGLAAAGPASAFDQAPLGIRRLARADHYDARAIDPVEERQAVHSQSGTRSASMIASAGIRSATTARRSPSTSTSGTKPRLL